MAATGSLVLCWPTPGGKTGVDDTFAQDTGLLIYKEKYAEFGQVALNLFMRADGVFAWRSSETNAQCPAVMIQCHS